MRFRVALQFGSCPQEVVEARISGISEESYILVVTDISTFGRDPLDMLRRARRVLRIKSQRFP